MIVTMALAAETGDGRMATPSGGRYGHMHRHGWHIPVPHRTAHTQAWPLTCGARCDAASAAQVVAQVFHDLRQPSGWLLPVNPGT